MSPTCAQWLAAHVWNESIKLGSAAGGDRLAVALLRAAVQLQEACSPPGELLPRMQAAVEATCQGADSQITQPDLGVETGAEATMGRGADAGDAAVEPAASGLDSCAKQPSTGEARCSDAPSAAAAQPASRSVPSSSACIQEPADVASHTTAAESPAAVHGMTSMPTAAAAAAAMPTQPPPSPGGVPPTTVSWPLPSAASAPAAAPCAADVVPPPPASEGDVSEDDSDGGGFEAGAGWLNAMLAASKRALGERGRASPAKRRAVQAQPSQRAVAPSPRVGWQPPPRQDADDADALSLGDSMPGCLLAL